MSYLLRKLLSSGGYMDEATDGASGDSSGGSAGAAETAAAAEAAELAASAAADAAKAAAHGNKKPTDEEARLLKENMKKKADLTKAQEELAQVKKQFEGIDPEAVRKLLADQKLAEDKRLEEKGDYERLKQRMAEEHTAKTKTLEEQIAALNSELSKSKGAVDQLSITTNFGQSKFVADELTLTPAKARIIYADHFDLEDGKVVGYDKPRGAANRTALVDQYGAPVEFDSAMRKIVEADPEKDYLLKSKTKAGAGSDSKRSASPQAAATQATNSISRIAEGLKSLKIEK